MVSGGRRRLISWLIEPYRQIKLGLMFLLVNLIFSLSVFSVFGYYFYDVYTSLTIYFGLASEQSSQVLSKLTVPVIIAAILMVVFILVSLIVSIRYTYAIYGPLVSIHRFLDAILDGRVVRPLVVRESDQLQDLARKLNYIAERLGHQRKAPLVPVYRFLDEIINGDKPENLSIGEMDQYSELVDKLNTLAKMIQTKSSDSVSS